MIAFNQTPKSGPPWNVPTRSKCSVWADTGYTAQWLKCRHRHFALTGLFSTKYFPVFRNFVLICSGVCGCTIIAAQPSAVLQGPSRCPFNLLAFVAGPLRSGRSSSIQISTHTHDAHRCAATSSWPWTQTNLNRRQCKRRPTQAWPRTVSSML